MSKRGSKSKPYVYYNKEIEKGSDNLVPHAKGAIPKLAVLLGLLSPFYYDLYDQCDGKTTISELASKMNINITEMRIYIDKLLKNGLIVLSDN